LPSGPATSSTPPSASWINQVERWFALLTEKQIRRGIHPSMAQLELDIRFFIETTNAEPKPFRWVHSANGILASIKRFCLRATNVDDEHQALSDLQNRDTKPL